MGDGVNLADVLAITKGSQNDENTWIFLLFFLFIFGGYGGYGFGNRGGGNLSNEVASDFTNAQIDAGFRQNAVINKLDGLTQGLCNSTYELSNTINSGFNNIGREVANGFCLIGRDIDSVKYEMSKGFCDVITANSMNTRDIIDSQNNGTQRILDFMQNTTIQDLRDRLAKAETIGLQENQTRYILEQLGRYVTNPPCVPMPYGFPNGYGMC